MNLATRSKAGSSISLPVCCTKPDCPGYQAALFLLQLWGLSHAIERDGSRGALRLEIPGYWGKARRGRFAHAVAGVPSKH